MPHEDTSVIVNYTFFKNRGGIKYWEVSLDWVCLCQFRLHIFQIFAQRRLIFSSKCFLSCYAFNSSYDYPPTTPKLKLVFKNSSTGWIALKWIKFKETD